MTTSTNLPLVVSIYNLVKHVIEDAQYTPLVLLPQYFLR